MPKYTAPISADDLGLRAPSSATLATPQLADVPVAGGNDFSRGLRSGLTSAGGQLRALAGNVAEAVGADQFAKEQYAKSVAAQQLAAEQAPSVTSYKDVHDVSSGLRYAEGLLGQGAPSIAAGLGAAGITALTKNPTALKSFLAGTAAVAPLEAGAAVQRQQADPEALKHSAAERLAVAGLEGTASSAIQNAVPLAMGGKVVGRAAGKELAPALVENLGEAVGGNAAAGTAAEKLHQEAASYLNPNRDTSQDTEQLKEAAIGGGVVGLPFAAVGTAGDMRGKSAVHADVPALEAPEAPIDPLHAKINDMKKTLNPEPVTGDHHAADMGVFDMDPEQQAETFDHADTAAKDKAQRTIDKLSESEHLTDKEKEQLRSYDPTDPEHQIEISALNTAAFERKTAESKAQELAKNLTPEAESGTMQSNDAVKPHEALAGIDLTEKGKQALTQALPHFIDKAESGPVSEQTLTTMGDVLGKKAATVLSKVYDGADPDKREQYFSNVSRLLDSQKGTDTLISTVRSSLPDHMTDRVTTPQIREFVDKYRALVNEEGTKGMLPAEERVHKERVMQGLHDTFGDKSEDVLEAFRADAERRSKEENVTPPAAERAADEGLTDEQPATRYFGPRGEEVDPSNAQPPFLLEKNEHRALYQTADESDTPHAASERKVASENPGSAVDWVSAPEYAKENHLSQEWLNQATNGEPEKYGLVRATGKFDPQSMRPADFDAMRFDTKYSKENPSRIELTDADGKQKAVVDGMRIVKVMQSKLGYEGGTPAEGLARTRAAFEAGISELINKYGAKIDPKELDNVVVTKRDSKDVTYQDLRNLHDAQLSPDDATYVKQLRSELSDAEAAGDHGKVRDIRDAIAHMHRDTGAEEAKGEGSDTPTTVLRRKLDSIQLAMDKIQTDMTPLAAREKSGEITAAEKNRLSKAREDWARLRRQERVLDPAIEKRETAERAQTLKDSMGVSDLSGADNVHLQSMEGEPATKQFDEAGNPLSYARKSKTVDPAEAQAFMENRIQIAERKIAAMDEMGTNSAPAKQIVGRAREVMNRMDELPQHLQARFLDALQKEKTIKGLGAAADAAFRYLPEKARETTSPAVKTAKWVEQVKSGQADVAKVLQNPNVKDVQAALLPLLRDKNPNEHVKAAVNQINEHISSVLAKDRDGTEAYKLQAQHLMESKEPLSKGSMSDADIDKVTKQIRGMLGDSIDLEVGAKGMKHAGEYQLSDAGAKGLLRVSVHALDPASVAYHESLHAFFDQMRKENLHDVNRVVERSAKSAEVMDVLRKRFSGNEAVLRQLENSREERAAYMFQLYAAGDKEMHAALGSKPRSIFQRIADSIKNMMGIWTNHERATHIMDYFQQGEYAKNLGDRNAVSQALIEPGRNKYVTHLINTLKPMRDLGTAVAVVGHQRIHDFENPALSRVVDLTRRRGFDEGSDPGYMSARRIESFTRKNKMMVDLHDIGATADDYGKTLAAMRLKDTSGLTPTQQKVAEVFRKTLDDTFLYMRKAGVSVKDYGFGTDYAPRLWDMHEIAAREPEFRAMLQKYIDNGSLSGDIEGMINRMMGNEGSEISTDAGLGPGNQFTKERILKMISAEDAEPFMEKDGLRTMSSYLEQASRRAEWARRFDAEGKPNGRLESMMQEAKERYGATDDQIKDTQKYLDGLNGTLGEKLSPTARKYMANLMITQNLALLPLGIFSAAIDANGILVNGGTVGDAFSAMTRGIKDIRKNFQNSPMPDAAEKFAEDMGVIESTSLHHALGGTTFGMTHASPIMRKANDLLFRFNGMEQWNSSMRVAATQAAVNFISRHAEGDYSAHSQRYLAELGLRASDIVKGDDGRALFTKNDLMRAGLDEKTATERSNKMIGALNRWVDGAVLRPDASQKPIWMNDPMFQIVGHMKQFAFSFQETTLKRVAHEIKHGNYAPVVALASYIPVMMAADAVKGLIQGGGQQPDWKENWGAGDYFGSAVQRAGLFGVGQFGVDAIKSLHHGGYGIGALGGPTINELGDVVMAAGGHGSFSDAALNVIPANSLWRHWGDHGSGSTSAPTEVMAD